MKKRLILIGIIGLLCCGCTPNTDINVPATDNQVITSSTSDLVVQNEDDSKDLSKFVGKNISEIIDSTNIIEMTDTDDKALNDAIGIYLMVDSTMKNASIKYWTEEDSNSVNNIVVSFEFPQNEIPEDFEVSLIESINGTLSVAPTSIQHSKLNILIYDTDGTIYIAESYNNKTNEDEKVALKNNGLHEYVQKDNMAEKVSRSIAGSNYIDIALGLKSYGFPAHTIKSVEELDCSYVETLFLNDLDTGARMSYDMYFQSYGSDAYAEVISANFDILNINGASNDEFIGLANSYLTYCSTMPYDSADATIAKNFISDNIDKVGEGNEGKEIIIGDAKLELYGTNLDSGIYGSRMLRISKHIN